METKHTGKLRWASLAFIALVIAAVCAIALPQTAWAETETVSGDNSVGSTLTSQDGAVTYQVITEATSSENGTVMLYSVSSARSGDYAICDSIELQTSGRGGTTYTFDVVAMYYRAFYTSYSAIASNITSLYIPASITYIYYTSVLSDYLYLYGCNSLESITVAEDNPSFCAVDNILFSKDMSVLYASAPKNEALGGDEGYTVPIETMKIGKYAFCNNESLKGVRFAGDLLGTSNLIGSEDYYAVSERAFSGCASLEWVEFPVKVAGIGRYAFENCTSLITVAFPEDDNCVIYNTYSNTIGEGAFSGCTSLEFISLPAVLGGDRRSDYYFKCSSYYPFSNFLFNSSYNRNAIYSGYSNKGWDGDSSTGLFGGAGIIQNATLSTYLFKDCTNLKTVVFRAGAPEGMMPYSGSRYAMFGGCDNLESIIFEAACQPYLMDPNRSITEANYTAPWSDMKAPTYYYAVDYYLTDDIGNIITEGYPETMIPDADSDDIYVVSDLMRQYFEAQDRLCRVEYARDTPTSAIAASDEDVLVEYRYAEASDYAQTGYSDGITPDPNEAAAQAGLDTSVEWVWKLSNTESRREGLSESCSAYLAPADDISAGRVAAGQIETEYKLCDQNLSRGFLPNEAGDGFVFNEDVGFDVARYWKYNTPGYDIEYNFGQISEIAGFEEGETAWFSISSTGENFYKDIEIVAADGTILDSDEYDITFQGYDADTGKMYDTALGQEDGPLLMIVTPTAQSGYTGVLKEWILTEHHAGTVKNLFTETAAGSRGTWYWGQYFDGISGSYASHVTYGSYTETVSTQADSASALLGASYAGLLRAKIQIQGSDPDYSGGFRLSVGNNRFNFSTEGLEDCASRAIAFYDGFEYNRYLLGASEQDYPWGDTAVLINPNYLDTTAAAAAAYAYAMCAPVFFTEADGSTVASDTREHLGAFDRVAIIGDEKTFSAAAFEALSVALGDAAEVYRITGDAGSACALSIAVADELFNSGVSDMSYVSVADGTDIFDTLGSLNLSGHQEGITLVSKSSADAKRISVYLRDNRDEAYTVRLFGRDSDNSIVSPFNLEDSISDLWGDTYVAPSIDAGDVITLWGVDFTIAGSASSGWTIMPNEGYTQEGKPTIEAGTYYYDGTAYVLDQTVNPKPTYAIDLETDFGGTVTLSSEGAYAGEMVLLTITPDEGYAISSLVAHDAAGSDIVITQQSDSVFTFIVPADAVIVTVTFSGGHGNEAGFTVVDNGTGVTAAADLSTSITNAEGYTGAELVITPLEKGNEDYDRLALVATGMLQNAYDVTLWINGQIQSTSFGEILLTFPVGSEYNGYEVKLWYLHSGEDPVYYLKTVAGGVVEVTVDRLSAFAIDIQPQETSGTGGIDTPTGTASQKKLDTPLSATTGSVTTPTTTTTATTITTTTTSNTASTSGNSTGTTSGGSTNSGGSSVTGSGTGSTNGTATTSGGTTAASSGSGTGGTTTPTTTTTTTSTTTTSSPSNSSGTSGTTERSSTPSSSGTSGSSTSGSSGSGTSGTSRVVDTPVLDLGDSSDLPSVDEAIDPRDNASHDDPMNNGDEEAEESSSVSPAVVAAIVVGAVCVAALAAALIYAMRKRRTTTEPID